MKETRSLLQIRIAAAKRLFMLFFLGKQLGLIPVMEFPKSGGTWFSQMLAAALDLPFPRNVTPKFEAAVFHGHILPNKRFGKMVSIIRDGRDVMVSAYFHFLFENNRNPKFIVRKTRKILGFKDYEDIEENLPSFIEYMFHQFSEGPFRSNWSEHVYASYNLDNVITIKYEDLLIDAKAELLKAMIFLSDGNGHEVDLDKIVETYSFKNQTKRIPGQENKKSFLRKGIAGDWKNHFNQKSNEVFDHYGGDALIKAGYETDHSWKS